MNKRIFVLVFYVAAMLAGRLAFAGIVDNGDGTATDTENKIIWQTKGDGIPRTWEGANAYCAALLLGEQTPWRLPNNKELFSLFEEKKKQIKISGNTKFPATLSSVYWSSTLFPPHIPFATFINFNVGDAGGAVRSSLYYVQCVR